MSHRIVPRKIIACLVIAAIATGCTNSVKIPMDQIDDPAWRAPGKYRLRLTDGGEYYVRRFSVADSNIVVDERLKVDSGLYGDTNPPSSSIPIDQIRSVEMVKSNKKSLLLFAGAVGAMATFFVIKMLDDNETY